jgi:transcriptional regulator with XRE-family HTH domain
MRLSNLGAQIGLTHVSIKEYEDEQAAPTSTTLLKLARALSVRAEYFFRQEAVVLNRIEYRKRSSLPKNV